MMKGSDTVVTSQNLPFQKVQHRVDTTDAQPSGETGGIIVMVTGALLVGDSNLQWPYTAVQGHLDSWNVLTAVLSCRSMISPNR